MPIDMNNEQIYHKIIKVTSTVFHSHQMTFSTAGGGEIIPWKCKFVCPNLKAWLNENPNP